MVRAGDLPTRRNNLLTLPSPIDLATKGTVEHVFIDCRGDLMGDAEVDECGVCGGSNYRSSPDGSAVNDPPLCALTVGGCECEADWTVPYLDDMCLVDDALQDGMSGCQYHGFDSSGNRAPVCHQAFGSGSDEYTSVDEFVASRPGQSWCVVSDDCETNQAGTLGSGAKLDFCHVDPDCPYTDVCGVCGGDGSTCTAGGCECESSWDVPYLDDACLGDGGGLQTGMSGCQFHAVDESGAPVPCHAGFGTMPDTAQSWCVVSADCQTNQAGTLNDDAGTRLDYCTVRAGYCVGNADSGEDEVCGAGTELVSGAAHARRDEGDCCEDIDA